MVTADSSPRYTSSPPVPIFSQINPVHAPIILLKVHLNIILPSMPGFHKSSHSRRFHHQNLYTPLLSLVRATCPAHPIIFTLITRIKFVMKCRSLHDHLQSFFSLYCFQLPSVMLHTAWERSGLILSLFDLNIPTWKSFKEINYSRILTCGFSSVGGLHTGSYLSKDNFMFIFKKWFCLSNQQLWHRWELWYRLKRLEMHTKFSSEYQEKEKTWEI
jgi:hypothetical protein